LPVFPRVLVAFDDVFEPAHDYPILAARTRSASHV
jgi:hypothetical protein